MSAFDTPEPITVTLDISVGTVTIAASDRADTVVEVRASDETDESDISAAAQTRVEYSGGNLLVKAPKGRVLDFSRKTRSVDVTIALPTGSRVHGKASMADFLCSGRLGECTVEISAGHIQLGEADAVRLHTGAGSISLDHAAGRADIVTGHGRLRLGDLDGGGTIKNSNGTSDVGNVSGHLGIRAANGDISVAQSTDGLDAKTANGNIRVDEATRGSLVLETAMGNLDVGIAPGAAAWLDVKTRFGRVHQGLDDVAHQPAQADQTVQVRARTSFGDITIRRA